MSVGEDCTKGPNAPFPLSLKSLTYTLEFDALTGFILYEILFDPIHPGVTENKALYETALVKFTVILFVYPVVDEQPSDNSTIY